MTGPPAGHDRLVPSQYVLVTADCRADHVGEVGGKAVGLGSLLRAGQRVPGSFVVAASAFVRYARSRAAGPDDPASLRQQAPGQEFRRSIEDSYAALGGRPGADVPVAVRSSATIEDSADASCAGQFMTFLGARGAAEVLGKIEECWISAFAPHVDSYRSNRGIIAVGQSVAVIVQELVDARVSGVMFTQHPRTADRSLVVIESSYGLGEAVVGGEVSPDLFEVNKITGQITRRILGSKATEHGLSADRRLVQRRPVEAARQEAWSLVDAEIAALLAMATELESALGRGLDAEWAIGTVESDGPAESLFALQVRPITARPAQGVRSAAPAGSGIDLILGRLSGRDPGGIS
jgi:phosphoenolpyruvate synthase/pyruvate phosphate dikinase